jgi:pimeloyl-ACP methyl ester carboxylesterase
MADTDAFYTPAPTTEYNLGTPDETGEQLLTFPSAMDTPHAANNIAYCRLFHARTSADRVRKGAVLVLPQWNSDADGHVGLCKLLTMHGLTAMRLSLPYHDRRMPPELHRADYIVSSNIVRTLQVCRQAVLDARRAIAWLHAQGYERIGILGSSLGSCLSLLTTAHEPLVRAQALNHISPYFADVVWRGISTAHVREGLDGHIELDLLRQLWQPLSPANFLERVRERKTLLVYARYDLTFPVDLSRELVRQFEAQGIPHELAVLRCGHYTTGIAPFKFIDGLILSRFLRRALLS